MSDKPSSNSFSLLAVLATIFGGLFVIHGNKDQGNSTTKTISAPTASIRESEAEKNSIDRLRLPLKKFLGIKIPLDKSNEKKDSAKEQFSAEVNGFLTGEWTIKGKVELIPEKSSPACEIMSPYKPFDDDEQKFVKELNEHVSDLNFIIATVADPFDTQVNYLFDQQVETLHKAMASEQYALSGFYSPWSSAKDAKPFYQTEPGVLLYRHLESDAKGNSTEKLVVVYLVGEVPTTGIHQQAFRAAMDEIRMLTRMHSPCTRCFDDRVRMSWCSSGKNEFSRQCANQKKCQYCDVKRILSVCGPTFSGSAHSLALAINQDNTDAYGNKQRFSYRVITGSSLAITGSRFLKVATAESKAEINCDKSKQKEFVSICGSEVFFHSTQAKEEVLRNSLIQFVSGQRKQFSALKLGANKLKIAWLVESSSGYGIGSSRPNEKAAINNEGSSSTKEPDPPEVTFFPIPLAIARLRSQVEVDHQLNDNAHVDKYLPSRYRVPIPFEHASRAKDVPPIQTPGMTAAFTEITINQILTKIRNEGYEYIGISLSDCRDPIFLSEMIHDQCPDAQILLVLGDAIHLHASYRHALHGALVASSYSLCPEDQQWCFPFNGNKSTVVVPTQETQGFYNAVVLLRHLQIHKTQIQEESKCEGSKHEILLNSQGVPKLLAYGMPLQNVGENNHTPYNQRKPAYSEFQPPIWVSMISPTGFWPLHCQSYKCASKKLPPAEKYLLEIRIPVEGCAATQLNQEKAQAKYDPRIAPSSEFVFFLMNMLAISYFLAVYGFLGGDWAEPLIMHDGPDLPPRSLMQAIFRILIWVTLGLLSSVHALLLSFPCEMQVKADLHIIIKANIVIAYISAGCMWSGCVTDLLFYWHKYRSSYCVLLVSNAITFAIACSTIIFYGFVANQGTLASDIERLFWYINSTDLWNGISLMLPLQFTTLALVALAYGMLAQLSLVSSSFAGSGNIKQRLNTNICQPRWEVYQEKKCRQRSSSYVSRLLVFPVMTVFLRNSKSLMHALRFDQQFVAVTSARSTAYWPLSCGFVVLLWLCSLWNRTESIEPFIVWNWIPSAFFLLVSLFWTWRLIKLLVICQAFSQFLRQTFDDFATDEPQDAISKWKEVFKRVRDTKMDNIASLVWTAPPSRYDRRIEKVIECYKDTRKYLNSSLDEITKERAGDKRNEDLHAIQVDLYCRQYFVHVRYLALGLLVSGALLVLTATSFPFNTEPLYQTTSIVMVSVLCATLVYYYMSFDRDPLLSCLLDSTPGHVTFDLEFWQNNLPVIGLSLFAVLSQAFPEMWQWLRDMLEPILRKAG